MSKNEKMAETEERVRRVLHKMHLVDTNGKLKQFDSMALIDLVVELENQFSLSIPQDRLQTDHFASVESLTRFMQDVRAEAK